MPRGIKGTAETFICLHCGTENKKKHSTKNMFCSNDCRGEYQKKQWFVENQEAFEKGELKSRAAYKRFIIERDGEQCSICGIGNEYNGKPLVMVIDHIDGDASNNHPTNFRLVCPNCDSQLPTFKARNTGNGRATKGMDWFSRL